MTTEIKGRFLATEFPHMLTGNPGASARNAGDTVVEIVTAMLRLDDLLPHPAATAILPKGLGVPDEEGANIIVKSYANKLIKLVILSQKCQIALFKYCLKFRLFMSFLRGQIGKIWARVICFYGKPPQF